MKPIRTVIVDDEPIARRGIRLELTGDKDIHIVGECRNAGQAVTSIKKEKPDLIFLDIQMPKRDGFSVLDELHLGEYPAVVFVTAYDEYALKAFDANAVDYVLKPIDSRRFQRALRRAKANIHKYRLLKRHHPQAGPETHFHRFIIRGHQRIAFVNADDIVMIESADNYVTLHIGTGSFLYRDTVKNLEKCLDPCVFVRIRRSTIVNMEHVLYLQREANGEYRFVMKGNQECRSSRRFRKNFRAHLARMKKNGLFPLSNYS